MFFYIFTQTEEGNKPKCKNFLATRIKWMSQKQYTKYLKKSFTKKIVEKIQPRSNFYLDFRLKLFWSKAKSRNSGEIKIQYFHK